jgi:hypothetical protein
MPQKRLEEKRAWRSGLGNKVCLWLPISPETEEPEEAKALESFIGEDWHHDADKSAHGEMYQDLIDAEPEEG